MKLVELRKEYLSNLMVLNVKLHNLHWNVVGPEFMGIHSFTESLYNSFFEKYDEVAEGFKIDGIFPPASLKEYVELSSINELDSRPINANEVLDIIKDDFISMNELALSIRNLADEEGDFELVGNMESEISFYRKNLWFINSIQG